MELYKHKTPLRRVIVVKRPSASIKSPYVADVMLEDGTTALCHTPGLGCCGLVEAGRVIYVTESSGSAKTAWTAQLAECEDSEGKYYVGIHPMVSQAAARGLLPLIDTTAVWKSEVTVAEGTRLDYVGERPDGQQVYVEIKTAMVSMLCDKPRAIRQSVFPEGFRKKKDEPVSPRAVKHAEHLGALAADGKTAVLLFLVPRNDCGDGMYVNPRDPLYCAAVRQAIQKGMIVRCFSLEYGLDGTVKLWKEVPFYTP
jgi:sugar fermentation stimulation protein A